MHELSIALGILDGVLEESQRRGGLAVETVKIRVGRLAGVDKDALLFAYQVAREDTPFATSRLEIEDVDVVILCSTCGEKRVADPAAGMICPQCGALATHIVHGEDLEICALEVVDER